MTDGGGPSGAAPSRGRMQAGAIRARIAPT